MTFFLVTIRHDQECDIIEFVDLLFPGRGAAFVYFHHRILSKESKFPSRPVHRFSRFFLKYLHPYSPFVWSVRPPDLLLNLIHGLFSLLQALLSDF